jgi:hypothetical protein
MEMNRRADANAGGARLRGSSTMTNCHSDEHPIATTGLDRFFRPTNLDRFRRLASSDVDPAEQRRLLEALSEETEAFRREARFGPNGRAAAIGIVLRRDKPA